MATAAPTLWVYKCNKKNKEAEFQGDWDEFSGPMKGSGIWGGTWCTTNHSSRKIIREEIKPGDLVLEWQTDMKEAVGLCRIRKLQRDGDDVHLYLRELVHFRPPVKLLEWKKKPGRNALANGSAFKQGRQGTVYETTPEEAKEILRICDFVTSGQLSRAIPLRRGLQSPPTV